MTMLALALVRRRGCRGGAARPADRFDSAAAWKLLREQVDMGPRPAGSETSRRLAGGCGPAPGGRFQAVPGGLRNVIGRVPGRGDGYVVVGAHYDTKDVPGFVGANDGASGTAVAVQLARTIEPRSLRRSVVFALFDGEESPRGTPDAQFAERGLRGSRVAAPSLRDARAMILLDFVGDRDLGIPREGLSDAGLWRRPGRPRARPGRRAPSRPRSPRRSGRPPAVPRGGGALDRPDRLHVPLLAQALRRPLGGVGAQPRPDGRDRAAAAR